MKRITILLAIATFLLLVPFAAAQTKGKTPFDPEKHSFKFDNNFAAIHQLGLGVDARTNGLCGGWSYAALDYYFAKRNVPMQDYRPPYGTPLYDYLRRRWAEAIEKNLYQWTELAINPGGVRDREIFEWGLQDFKGGRLQELRSFIDRGVPVPLGLKWYKGNIAKDHVVIAIGYDLGRYKGDLKSYKGDLQIFVCDPNFPGETKTVIPTLNDAKNGWYYAYSGDADPTRENRRWRAYFVDTRYARKAPPKILDPKYSNDGTVRELILTFGTGADDLRGGNDNINLAINFFDGTKQDYQNINRGAKFPGDTTGVNVQVVLRKPAVPKQIKSLVLSTTFTGGLSGDNWDMKSVSVRAIGGGIPSQLASSGSFRFTGEKKQLTIPVNTAPATPGQVTKLVLEMRTGGDDLRGGNDNLNIETLFKDNRSQKNQNVNDGKRWADNTTNSVTITLDRPVPVSDIKGIKLSTTFSGGGGGDNWNMDKLSVRAVGSGVNRLIATYGSYRFTGEKKHLTIPAN